MSKSHGVQLVKKTCIYFIVRATIFLPNTQLNKMGSIFCHLFSSPRSHGEFKILNITAILLLASFVRTEQNHGVDLRVLAENGRVLLTLSSDSTDAHPREALVAGRRLCSHRKSVRRACEEVVRNATESLLNFESSESVVGALSTWEAYRAQRTLPESYVFDRTFYDPKTSVVEVEIIFPDGVVDSVQIDIPDCSLDLLQIQVDVLWTNSTNSELLPDKCCSFVCSMPE
jgi:hypothetical protein